MPLIGNKFAERDLRDWLQSHGYFGRSAEITELELVAVRRPGWEQVFRFRLRAKRQDETGWEDLAGILRDDERRKQFDVRLTTSDEDHDAAMSAWTDGMILRGRRARDRTELVLIWLAAAVLVVVGGIAVLRNAL